MTPKQRRRLMGGQFRIELTQEEVLEDLSWPGPPPGRWLEKPAEVRHIDTLLQRIEKAAA